MARIGVAADITKWAIFKCDGRWAVTPPLKLADGTPVPVWLLDGHSFDSYEEAIEAFADRLCQFRRVVVGE